MTDKPMTPEELADKIIQDAIETLRDCIALGTALPSMTALCENRNVALITQYTAAIRQAALEEAIEVPCGSQLEDIGNPIASYYQGIRDMRNEIRNLKSQPSSETGGQS